MLILLVILAGITTVLTAAVLIIVLRRSQDAPSSQPRLVAIERGLAIANAGQNERLQGLERTLTQGLESMQRSAAAEREERSRIDLQARQELAAALTRHTQSLVREQTELAKSVNDAFLAMTEANANRQVQQGVTLKEGLTEMRTTNVEELERIRLEVGQKLQDSLTQSLKENSMRIEEMRVQNTKLSQEIREALQSEIEKLRTGNEEQLEKMRATVDEKLQGTLEKRLGDSFKLVSDRLEEVHRGLGEMKNLASDVGGLKKVLSNVKSRGTWGEVQLRRQLEDLLTPGQFAENVEVKPGSGERVEFAIKLPGREDDTVYLAIDSKFPQESYERLLQAQDSGDPTELATASKELERALRLQSQTIGSKYIDPPHSTDFAIMYLPTEGLFAEALRIPGLVSEFQQKHRVMVTGPTTLMSLLNSLQMGFRTLAIEKRSSEVWQVLGAAKKEFEKYEDVWERVEKQLSQVQRTVKSAGVRTRAVRRQLRDVESLELPGGEESPLQVVELQ